MTADDRRKPPSEMAVLLVDDDVEWVAATGASLETAEEALSVVTATGGWEALDLLEGEAFDCVVCDYRMPDFDGIALLERVRAEHGDVPFILVTGTGSEAVASRAISSRVTDYFVKEPGRDQSRALATRIRTAVESHRTERALDAARRRFTELFEGVPDPVAITDDGRTLRAVNEAFVDVFDGERATVEGSTLDDVIGGTDDGAAADAPVRELEVDTSAGRRAFLVRRFPLEGRDSREFGHVFTDVTRQRDRERELERFHELSAEVREILLSAGSRRELEVAFCEAVADAVDDSTALLAHGGTAEEVSVRATAGGDSDQLGRVLFDLDGVGRDADDGNPVATALSTGEPRYAHVTDRTARWAVAARTHGVQEVLAVPVERVGVPTGVFVVCSAGALDEVTSDRLEGLVSSLGDAIDLFDRVTALTADRAVRVGLTVGGDTLLNALAEAADAAVDVLSAVPGEADAVALYVALEGDGLDHVTAWLDGAPDVDRWEVLREGTHPRLRVDATAPTVPATLSNQPVAVRTVRAQGGRTATTFDVPMSADVRATVESVEDVHGPVSVDSIRTVDREEPGGRAPLDDLTDKQRRALEIAFHEGYFEQPRTRSADEVADALGVSRSTFLQHLRAAERKLLANLFAWKPADGGEER